jgi:hypothetical protein
VRLRKRVEDAVCLGILLVVALVALWPAVFQGQVPYATRSVLFQTPWEAARPEGMSRPLDAHEQIQAVRYYPWHVYLASVARGEGSLLWNPLEGCGQPFLAVWRTRCLSPFSIPFYVLPLNTAVTVSLLLKLLVAAAAAYYAARKLGLKPPLALSAALAFQLSGHMYLWLDWPVSDVLPWLPLLLLSVERLAVGQARYWTVGAIVAALMALGGDPETFGAAALFCLVYFVIRAGFQQSSSNLGMSSAAVAALGAAGLALAAVQLVPYAEFLREASSTGSREAATTLRLPDLVLVFLPRFLGRSLGVWGADGAMRHARVIRLLHVGVLQVLLVAVWFSVRSFAAGAQRRRYDALLWTALAMTGLAMAAGRALADVPLLRWLGPEHLLAGNALALGLVAAAAADEWLLLNAQQCWRALRRLILYLPLLIVLGAAAAAAHHRLPRIDASPLWLQALKSGLLLAALLALLAGTLIKPSRRLMGYSLAGLTCISLAAAWTPGLRYIEPRLAFPNTPLVQAMRSSGDRVGGSSRLAQWPFTAELVPQVFAPSGIALSRQQTFWDRLQEEPLLLRRCGSPALLLTKEDIQGAYAPVRPMLSIDRVFPSGAILFSDLASKPRAWVAGEVRTVQRGHADVLHPDLPPLVETTAPAAGSSGTTGKAVIVEESATSVTVAVETQRPATLVLADTYYPGWRARIDGTDVPVYPVDVMFRGVTVDAGKHQVEFYYAPRSVRIGLYITLAAAAIVLIELRRVFWRAYY